MMTKKQYWYEALVGGTIVGVVAVAFSILLKLMGGTTAVFVNITLLFGLTRRFSAKHTPEEGFSFGRGLGFVVAMMIFAGVISGIYSSVMANYFIKEEVLHSVDEVMAQLQDVYPAEQFDSLYTAMQKAVINPVYLTLSSVISNCFTGALVGLFVGFLTRRRPDIFATPMNDDNGANQ